MDFKKSVGFFLPTLFFYFYFWQNVFNEIYNYSGRFTILSKILKSDEFVRAVAVELDRGMLAPGESVVVGVSGGADSMALLATMAYLARDKNRRYHIIAAHLNHSLRDQAHLDEAFVKDCCEQLGLPFICETVDTKVAAGKFGEGIEHAARELRYEFFKSTAVAFGAGKVALAHHGDDNVETVLFRMFRGSGLRGIAGIAPMRELCSEPRISLIRPMLGIDRAKIVEFCRANAIPWREDHTNSDTTYTRNFIRHDLLSMLQERFGRDVRGAIGRLARQARSAEEYIYMQAMELLNRAVAYDNEDSLLVDMKIFAGEPEILRTTALRLATEKLNIPQRDLTSEHIMNMALLVRGKVVNLPSGFHALRRGDMLVIEKVESSR